jgi:hypothetical protein
VKLALIRLVAGAEHHALLDIVFGEIDKNVAALLEKHFVGMCGDSLLFLLLHRQGCVLQD